MRVVINVTHGGFGLSEAAVRLCLERGMTFTEDTPAGDYVNPRADFSSSFGPDTYYALNINDKAFRTHPVVLGVVQELNEQADGRCARLKILDIPFETLEGWGINDNEGWEHVEETHRTWG